MFLLVRRNVDAGNGSEDQWAEGLDVLHAALGVVTWGRPHEWPRCPDPLDLVVVDLTEPAFGCYRPGASGVG